jgi:hypothetical protein
MGAWCPALDPADMQRGAGKIDLVPAEVHQLGHPQTVPPRHKDHCAVAVAPAVALRRLDELVHLGLGEVFAAAQVGIGAALRRNCSFFGGWRDKPEAGFGQGFRSLRRMTVRITAEIRTVGKPLRSYDALFKESGPQLATAARVVRPIGPKQTANGRHATLRSRQGR